MSVRKSHIEVRSRRGGFFEDISTKVDNSALKPVRTEVGIAQAFYDWVQQWICADYLSINKILKLLLKEILVVILISH